MLIISLFLLSVFNNNVISEEIQREVVIPYYKIKFFDFIITEPDDKPSGPRIVSEGKFGQMKKDPYCFKEISSNKKDSYLVCHPNADYKNAYYTNKLDDGTHNRKRKRKQHNIENTANKAAMAEYCPEDIDDNCKPVPCEPVPATCKPILCYPLRGENPECTLDSAMKNFLRSFFNDEANLGVTKECQQEIPVALFACIVKCGKSENVNAKLRETGITLDGNAVFKPKKRRPRSTDFSLSRCIDNYVRTAFSLPGNKVNRSKDTTDSPEVAVYHLESRKVGKFERIIADNGTYVEDQADEFLNRFKTEMGESIEGLIESVMNDDQDNDYLTDGEAIDEMSDILEENSNEDIGRLLANIYLKILNNSKVQNYPAIKIKNEDSLQNVLDESSENNNLPNLLDTMIMNLFAKIGHIDDMLLKPKIKHKVESLKQKDLMALQNEFEMENNISDIFFGNVNDDLNEVDYDMPPALRINFSSFANSISDAFQDEINAKVNCKCNCETTIRLKYKQCKMKCLDSCLNYCKGDSCASDTKKCLFCTDTCKDISNTHKDYYDCTEFKCSYVCNKKPNKNIITGNGEKFGQMIMKETYKIVRDKGIKYNKIIPSNKDLDIYVEIEKNNRKKRKRTKQELEDNQEPDIRNSHRLRKKSKTKKFSTDNKHKKSSRKNPFRYELERENNRPRSRTKVKSDEEYETRKSKQRQKHRDEEEEASYKKTQRGRNKNRKKSEEEYEKDKKGIKKSRWGSMKNKRKHEKVVRQEETKYKNTRKYSHKPKPEEKYESRFDREEAIRKNRGWKSKKMIIAENGKSFSPGQSAEKTSSISNERSDDEYIIGDSLSEEKEIVSVDLPQNNEQDNNNSEDVFEKKKNEPSKSIGECIELYMKEKAAQVLTTLSRKGVELASTLDGIVKNYAETNVRPPQNRMSERIIDEKSNAEKVSQLYSGLKCLAKKSSCPKK